MQIGIVECNQFSATAIKKLNEIGEVSLFKGGDLKNFVEDKEILFIRLKYKIDESLLRGSDKIKIICTPTTGLNHIDTDYTSLKQIEIISLKGETDFLSNIRATPEHTLGLIFALLRNYNKGFITKKTDFNRDLFKGHEIYQNKFGIIGFGRVGKLLSRYLHSLGGEVFYYDIDPQISPVYNETRTLSLEDLINLTNVVILCASFSENNRSLINKYYIDLMRDKFFINTARGELIDENYLLKKIEDNHFKGVAIDVIANETDNKNIDKMLQLCHSHHFIVTPHIGGATYESMERTEIFIVDKLISHLNRKK